MKKRKQRKLPSVKSNRRVMRKDNFFARVSILIGLLVSTLGNNIAVAQSRTSPALGADLTFADWPHPLIAAWQDKDRGDEMADAFRNVGLHSLRLSFSGIYSPRGQQATDRVRAENKTTNDFPWFPFDQYVDWIVSHRFTTVVGINVEEGPAVAEEVVKLFIDRRAKKRLIALELSNEPHLNHRPWLPEEYAARAADVIERLTPMNIHFGLPLTVGGESKTPTKLSDDEWNRRMLRALAVRIDLKNRGDIYGVLHLYAGGVRAKSLDLFNRAVRPFAPRMRYLVTEFNIRSSLEGNPQLTNRYAMEFARKLAELMASPDIEAMYVHSVPYHSIVYWSNGKRLATVIGQRDPRLTPDDLTRGWHQTPAGRVYGLFSRLAWNGELIAYSSGDRQRYWAVRDADGHVVVTLLNDEDKTYQRKVKIGGLETILNAPPRSIICFNLSGAEIDRLVLK